MTQSLILKEYNSCIARAKDALLRKHSCLTLMKDWANTLMICSEEPIDTDKFSTLAEQIALADTEMRDYLNRANHIAGSCGKKITDIRELKAI